MHLLDLGKQENPKSQIQNFSLNEEFEYSYVSYLVSGNNYFEFINSKHNPQIGENSTLNKINVRKIRIRKTFKIWVGTHLSY